MSSTHCSMPVSYTHLDVYKRQEVHNGSALDLQFADESFDAVWMQNVGMNILDKQTLYAEVCRVLKPGGRFAFQEMAAGNAATTYFPCLLYTSRCV